MYKNLLAHRETYYEGSAGYEIETSFSVYEVYIELGHDKEGNVMKNRDGSDRYFAIDDAKLQVLDREVVVKKIRDGLYKDVFTVNGDYVEKIDRDGKRIYYVVEEEKIVHLPAGTKYTLSQNGMYKVPNEVGYAVVDDKDIENPKTIRIRKFQSEDHKAEAEEVVKKVGNRNRE